MSGSKSTQDVFLKVLNQNMGFKEGMSLAIIAQSSSDSFSEKVRKKLDESYEVAKQMHETYSSNGINTTFHEYTPEIPRNGVDAPSNFYDISADIVLMPTAYSLSHTSFRKHLTEKGCRVATIPGVNLKMCLPGGPLDADPREMAQVTNELAEKMRESKEIYIGGKRTEMRVRLDPSLIYAGTGLHTEGNAWGNLPGAEAYGVPITADGFFTVPAGWGGEHPLPHTITFYVGAGKFVRAVGETLEAEKYIQKELAPLFQEPGFNVLAELGIGTNPNVKEHIQNHGWSTLLAEKIAGSVHFANGNNKAMGGTNDVPIHIDWVVPAVQIQFIKASKDLLS